MCVTLGRPCYTNDDMGVLGSVDAARLAALRAGDERAFAELVDELSPRMLRLARVYLAGVAIAEEAVQEAWIVVLRTPRSFRGSLHALDVDLRHRGQRCARAR